MHINYCVITTLQEEKKRTNLLVNKKIFFASEALNFQEEISQILKHLHAPFKPKKGEWIDSNKANSLALQLSARYVQKEGK